MMMMTQRVELVYFEGCPNALQARENIKSALDESGCDIQWSEWDLASLGRVI